MHAALMIDEQTLRRERDWYNRTVVGLLTSGVRISRLLPEGEREDPRAALAPARHYRQQGLAWTVSRSLAEIGDALGAARPDVVHVIGVRAWSGAVALARLLERPVAVSIWSTEEAKWARKLARRPEIGGFLVATEPLAEKMRQYVSGDLVQIVPLGVFCRRQPSPILEQIETSVPVVAAGRAARHTAMRALLEGFAEVAREFPQTMLFADLSPGMDDLCWRFAGQLGIHGQLSIIPDVEEHRELVLNASILVIPAATARANTFVLQAMSQPCVTVAIRDPLIEVLNSDALATTLVDPGPADWADALRHTVNEPEAARQRALAAREVIASRHAMSAQIDALCATYERIVVGDTLPMHGPDAPGNPAGEH